MKLTGYINLRGYGIIRHFRNGKLVSEQKFTNTITESGIRRVAGLINGEETTAFSYLQLGTSGTQASSTDTALLSPITAGSLAPTAATTSQITTDTTDDTAYFVKSWSATASYTVKEIAIGTSATAPTILCRTTNFTAVGLTDGDSVSIYYKIDVD